MEGKVKLYCKDLNVSNSKSFAGKFCYQKFITQGRAEWVTEFMQPSRASQSLSFSLSLYDCTASMQWCWQCLQSTQGCWRPSGDAVVTSILWCVLCSVQWSDPVPETHAPAVTPLYPQCPVPAITWMAKHMRCITAKLRPQTEHSYILHMITKT